MMEGGVESGHSGKTSLGMELERVMSLLNNWLSLSISMHIQHRPKDYQVSRV